MGWEVGAGGGPDFVPSAVPARKLTSYPTGLEPGLLVITVGGLLISAACGDLPVRQACLPFHCGMAGCACGGVCRRERGWRCGPSGNRTGAWGERQVRY
jgi:hypothetical protein